MPYYILEAMSYRAANLKLNNDFLNLIVFVLHKFDWNEKHNITDYIVFL